MTQNPELSVVGRIEQGPKPMNISAERLHELFDYDPETGVFRWKVNHRNGVRAGRIAGTPSDGYLKIMVDGRSFRAHRLAWLYVYGAEPSILDHINGVRDDNRIANLREATLTENRANQKMPRRNTSGFLGVTWHSGAKKWRAIASVRGKNKYLGCFEKPEEAADVYDKFIIDLRGEFARPNRAALAPQPTKEQSNG